MTIASFKIDEALQGIIDDFYDDRIGFVKHVIGVTPTEQQAEGLLALDSKDHVTIKSGHGTGKSGMQSWVILHYMSCRLFPKIPCTAPSKHQLYDVLWAELSKWHRKLNPAFRSQFIWTKEKFFHKDHSEEWFAVARTASKENPEALQGFHADYVLRVIDEASAVPEEVFEVLEGGHGMIETKELMCGNPTRLTGNFFESFNKSRNFYNGMTWSCLDSPIVPQRYIDRITNKYGEDSNMYRIRVKGDFPLRDGDSFIPFDLAYDAVNREIPSQKEYPMVFGCDIARFGEDETVIAIRQGDEFRPYHVLRNKSTMEVASYIGFLANKEKPLSIFIDVIGLGAGVFDRLEELGFPVYAVNVAESPAVDAKRFKRLRDELWGLMRDWLEMRRGKLWDNEDSDLLGQLTTPKYKITHDGKIVIETKDDMRKRGVSSPNIADAVNMTFAQPISNYQKQVDEFWDELHGDRDSDYAPLDAESGY